MKQNILVIFGGKSVEHDISIITGLQAINNIDKQKYTIYPVYIDKQGRWFFSDKFNDINNLIDIDKKSKKIFKTTMFAGDSNLYLINKNKVKTLAHIDCVLCCTHGGSGENGALQGFLDVVGVPYTCPKVLSSAICMDKLISKILFEKAGLNVTQYLSFSDLEIKNNLQKVIKTIESKFNYPIVIKPCCLGSSIGISFVKNKSKLNQALLLASSFDSQVLVEEAVQNLQEINVSVMSIDGKIVTSVLEKPKTQKEILSFDEKYLQNPNQKSGMSNFKRELPAKITNELWDKIVDMSKTAYKICKLNGLVRIDYLLNDKTQQVYINEINTIPGSLSFYLWQYDKYSFDKLIDLMIQQAIKQHQIIKQKTIIYNTNVLQNFALSSSSSNKFNK